MQQLGNFLQKPTSISHIENTQQAMSENMQKKKPPITSGLEMYRQRIREEKEGLNKKQYANPSSQNFHNKMIQEAQQQQQVVNKIPNQGKTKKKRAIWPDDGVLLQVFQPIQLNLTTTNKKRFAIQFTYTSQGKKMQKTVKFAKHGQLFRIDLHDENKAHIQNSQFQRFKTPFDPNFWTINLLNSADTLGEAFYEFLKRQKLLL